MLQHHLPVRDPRYLRYRQYSALWQREGFGYAVSELPASDTLLSFTTDSGWNGVVDVVCWFAEVAPDLAGQASAAWSLAQLVTLFSHSQTPFRHADLPQVLHCQRIRRVQLLGRERPACCHGFPTAAGEILFCHMATLPQLRGQLPGVALDSVPLPLALRIGSSWLSYCRFSRLQIGDALLLQYQDKDMLSGAFRLGGFIRFEEGVMFEESRREAAPQPESHTISAQLPAQIPVKLEFILQQKTITFGELAEIYRGAMIGCEPEAEKQIIIRANGLPVASGELVWFNDRLAVEVRQLYQEADGGE